VLNGALLETDPRWKAPQANASATVAAGRPRTCRSRQHLDSPRLHRAAADHTGEAEAKW
jgi:hypothetical protein